MNVEYRNILYLEQAYFRCELASRPKPSSHYASGACARAPVALLIPRIFAEHNRRLLWETFEGGKLSPAREKRAAGWLWARKKLTSERHQSSCILSGARNALGCSPPRSLTAPKEPSIGASKSMPPSFQSPPLFDTKFLERALPGIPSASIAIHKSQPVRYKNFPSKRDVACLFRVGLAYPVTIYEDNR